MKGIPMQKKCGIILFDVQSQCFFLVFGRKSRKWGFPKGHMEENETERVTALREFFEETGYVFRDENQIDFSQRFQIKNNIYFQIKITSREELIQKNENIPDKNEILMAEWKEVCNILNLNISDCNFGLKFWILKKKYKSLQAITLDVEPPEGPKKQRIQGTEDITPILY